MHHILLIGAGRAGLAHLAALMQIKLECRISVLDVNDSALGQAQSLFKRESYHGHVRELNLYHNFGDLNEDINLAILAVHADTKPGLLKALLRQTIIENVLIESAVAQSKADFHEVVKIVDSNGVKGWAYNPRRLYPVYDEVKKFFSSGMDLMFQVDGGSWEMASHVWAYMDQFSHMYDGQPWKVTEANFQNELSYSPRNSTVHFRGHMSFEMPDRTRFTAADFKEKSDPVVTVFNKKSKFIIKEKEGKILFGQAQSNWEYDSFDTDGPLGDMMTEHIASAILRGEPVNQPTLKEAQAAMNEIYPYLLSHMQKFEHRRRERCPIA